MAKSKQNTQAKTALSKGGLGELKRRLLFLLFAIVVFRIGAHIPIPGLDPHKLAVLFIHTSGCAVIMMMLAYLLLRSRELSK